ncbi:MAG: hypothetical protein IJ719_18945 [Clostridia bacterium]|nr:hypothetical protein [Clostridia bacterium]
MLISNFEYLSNCDFPSKIRKTCQKAEEEYIGGSFETCIITCRQATEYITKLVFDDEILFDKPIWYTEFSQLYDLLSSNEFRKAFSDGFTLKEVDEKIRKPGNACIHGMDTDITVDDGYEALRTLFVFVTRIHNLTFQEPYTESFIEPYYWDESTAPLEVDYLSLIQEEQDPELKAKYALLRKCEDEDFAIQEFVENLPEESGIKRLIAVLTDTKMLRQMLAESPIQLRKQIANCYFGFNYQEEDAVIAYSIKACRRIVKASYKFIQQFLKAENEEDDENE